MDHPQRRQLRHQGTFVKADVTTGVFADPNDPDAYNHFVKLIE